MEEINRIKMENKKKEARINMQDNNKNNLNNFQIDNNKKMKIRNLRQTLEKEILKILLQRNLKKKNYYNNNNNNNLKKM